MCCYNVTRHCIMMKGVGGIHYVGDFPVLKMKVRGSGSSVRVLECGWYEWSGTYESQYTAKDRANKMYISLSNYVE